MRKVLTGSRWKHAGLQMIKQILFTTVFAGCSHVHVVDGRVSDADHERLQRLAGVYEGRLKLYGPNSVGETIILKNATLNLTVDSSGLLILDIKPSMLENNCNLHFTKLLSVEDVRTRLRGQFSLEMEFAIDRDACREFPGLSVARVVMDPNRNGKQVAELRVVKKYELHGSFWESDAPTFYGGSFVKR